MLENYTWKEFMEFPCYSIHITEIRSEDLILVENDNGKYIIEISSVTDMDGDLLYGCTTFFWADYWNSPNVWRTPTSFATQGKFFLIKPPSVNTNPTVVKEICPSCLSTSFHWVTMAFKCMNCGRILYG